MTTSGHSTEAKRERLRAMIPQGAADAATGGVDHIAVFAKDLEQTARFYSNIMGMPVTRVTANRAVAESTHMNVAIGNGMTLAFFDFPDVPRLQRRAAPRRGGRRQRDAHRHAHLSGPFRGGQDPAERQPGQISGSGPLPLFEGPQRARYRVDAALAPSGRL